LGGPRTARPSSSGTAATTRCVVHLERSLWRRMRTPQARCTGLPDSSPWRLARSRLTPGTSLRRVRPRYVAAGSRRDAVAVRPGPSPRAWA